MLTDTLLEARNWLADPNNWCQFDMYNKQGQTCAVGALTYVSGKYNEEAHRFMIGVAHELYGTGPMGVNDCIGYDAVMEMFDAAIHKSKNA